MRETLSPLELINDTAERGVRDIQEYVNAARDGGQKDVSFLFPMLTKLNHVNSRKIR